MTRLRTVLLICALLFTALGCELAAPGQTDSEEKVTILGAWTGPQETGFKKLLDELDIPYEYEGTAAQREVLLSQVQAGEPPDIVIMPGLGELAEYAHQERLQKLDDDDFEKSEYGPALAALRQRLRRGVLGAAEGRPEEHRLAPQGY
ncbi:hypothetical protein [Streptomyces flaveus]|uniref:ABC transporter substrate-binding protein n=1 Tax=Streptomyces flaveus TaxID=66370 RepID=A0A917QH22_9ACTN|nr:hypothetical protein [Streptomyces flaveus]GGK50065.1 hypothetical protein GCM10010094_07790 [Streptomyces flaveus]